MGPGHRSSEAFVFGEVKRSERRDEKGYRQTVKRQQHDAVECNDSVRVQKKHSTRSSSFWHAVRRIAALSVVVVVADDGLYGNGSQLREESSTERQSPEQQLHSLCLLHSLLSLSLSHSDLLLLSPQPSALPHCCCDAIDVILSGRVAGNKCAKLAAEAEASSAVDNKTPVADDGQRRDAASG